MSAPELLVVKCLTLCAIYGLMSSGQSECFSTPSERARTSGRGNSQRAYNELDDPSRPETSSKGYKENAYTENYITAIEDDAPGNGERGFMVATTDHNYAIYSPTLKSRGWTTITVNGDQVFIATTRNQTLSTSLFGLDEQQRDFISEVRANFTPNLGGLKFAHYTSGSSTQLAELARSKSATSAMASMAYKQIGSIPAGATSSGYHHIEPPLTAATIAAPSAKAGLLQSNGLPPSAGAFFSRSLAKSKRSYERRSSRAPTRLRWRYKQAARLYGTPEMFDAPPPPPPPRPKEVVESISNSKPTTEWPARAKSSLCSPDRANQNFNYYNLLQAPLNVTLTGDVYYFDLHCNILDVYSASVSVRQAAGGLSALYRDANFFSYARANLPLSINRFFLLDEHVFFVYNDGSVLAKTNWMLDQTELDVVIEARQQLKLVGQWQGRAADLLAKSVTKS